MMGISRTTAYNPKHAVHCLMGALVVLLGLYMYFISSSVMYVVMRSEAEQSIQSLRSEISVLEGKYIAAQHRVSEHISMLEGYDEVTEKTFIDRRAPSLVLGTTN